MAGANSATLLPMSRWFDKPTVAPVDDVSAPVDAASAPVDAASALVGVNASVESARAPVDDVSVRVDEVSVPLEEARERVELMPLKSLAFATDVGYAGADQSFAIHLQRTSFRVNSSKYQFITSRCKETLHHFTAQSQFRANLSNKFSKLIAIKI